MKNFICLLICVFIPTARAFAQPNPSQCFEADIVFVLDWSSSVDTRGHFISEAATEFVQEMKLGPSLVKIGVIPFNSFILSQYATPPSYDRELLEGRLSRLAGTVPANLTDIHGALCLAEEYFQKSAEERGVEPRWKIIVIISDGEENQGSANASVLKSIRLKEDRVLIYAISVDGSVGIEHLKNLSSGDEFYIEMNYESLKNGMKEWDPCM